MLLLRRNIRSVNALTVKFLLDRVLVHFNVFSAILLNKIPYNFYGKFIITKQREIQLLRYTLQPLTASYSTKCLNFSLGMNNN